MVAHHRVCPERRGFVGRRVRVNNPRGLYSGYRDPRIDRGRDDATKAPCKRGKPGSHGKSVYANLSSSGQRNSTTAGPLTIRKRGLGNPCPHLEQKFISSVPFSALLTTRPIISLSGDLRLKRRQKAWLVVLPWGEPPDPLWFALRVLPYGQYNLRHHQRS